MRIESGPVICEGSHGRLYVDRQLSREQVDLLCDVITRAGRPVYAVELDEGSIVVEHTPGGEIVTRLNAKRAPPPGGSGAITS